VKFNDVLGAGSGMKTVNVLGGDDDATTLILQPRLTLGDCHVSLKVHRKRHHYKRTQLRVGRSNGSTFEFQKSKMAADGQSWIYKNGNNFATGLLINMMFGSMAGFPNELRFLP